LDFAESLELCVRQDSTFKRLRARLPTYLADIREDPSFLPMFLLARTMPARKVFCNELNTNVPEAPAAPSMFQVNARDVSRALHTDGLFEQIFLPPAITGSIRWFADNTPCFGNHDRSRDLLPWQHIAMQSKAMPVTSAHYFERVADCPAIMAVQADPLLHTVASAYLGPRAQVISTRLWWSFPPPGEATPEREMMHFDLDDWRMLKFFFYLSPVDADAGPHLFVRGSHRHHVLKHQLSLTVSRPLDEVLDTYGADKLTAIHGPAGAGFAEDPFGFHAGSLARAVPRLMLEVGFGITPPNQRRFFGERVLRGGKPIRRQGPEGSSRYVQPPASGHAQRSPWTTGTPRS
jgi:hypothetical protein